MLASLGPMPRDHRPYAFEYKWDGVRAIAYIQRSCLRIESRNLIDITRRYPELAALCETYCDRNLILDGEIVALDDQSRPSFARLQRRMHLNDTGAIQRAVREIPICYFIFDILHLDERPTISLPYLRRRELLEQLELAGANWQLTPAELRDGHAMLESAQSLGLEGIVAKRLDSTYQPGRRSSDWVKIKLVDRQEFVIGGWTPETGAPNRVGSLLVGYYEPAETQQGKTARLRYAGRVGSGFNHETHEQLVKLLRSNARGSSPFSDRIPRRDSLFVEPRLVAEVEFRGWTNARMLRQPAFKGLRTDKEPAEVILEKPQ